MENYTLHRGRLIDHIQLVVNNFDASKAFYTAVLAELKIPLVITDDDYIWADELVISSVKSSESGGVPTGRHHLAFQAADRESVNAFNHAALNHGGRDNGAPPNEPTIPDTMPLLFWIRTVTILKLFTMVRAIAVPAL